mmetsp:Transcript_17736/g.29735  ORF Transcript_17736/g.29735 Transcript_17736/m.29735 type:complete len:270 (-) Transcript_17736:134-943(-)
MMIWEMMMKGVTISTARKMMIAILVFVICVGPCLPFLSICIEPHHAAGNCNSSRGGGGGGGSTAINSSNHNRDSVAYEDREDSESGTGGRGNFSNKYTGSVGNNEIMRIGIGSNMTESLIASANMRVVSSGRRSNRLGTIGGGGGDSSSSSSSSQYRNICNDDNDYIDDNIAADAVTGTGNMLSTVELSDVDNQRRSALFGSARSRYSSNTTNPLHSSSIRNTGSNSAAGNHSPMLPVPPHPPRPTTDLFSIVDNEDEENIYGGRYADS